MGGGLATVLHGYARFTADADLVVDLGWQAVTWDGNRDTLLDSTLTATPAQRLAWLEDTIEIAYRAGALSDRTAGDEGNRNRPPPADTPSSSS